MEVHRGEVFYADLSPVVGSEQGGIRPVLIVQNEIGIAKDSVVLLEQIRTLDKHRLRERAGQITPEDQRRVNQALDVSLGLDSY